LPAARVSANALPIISLFFINFFILINYVISVNQITD